MLHLLLAITLITFLLFAQENFKPRLFICVSLIAYTLFQLFVVDWLLTSNLFLGILVVLINTIWFGVFIIPSYFLYKKSEFFKGYYFFILLWLLNEYSHLYGVFHWPWLNLGNFFSVSPNLIQWYEYTGVAGGTLWILVFSSLLHYLFKSRKKIILFYIGLVVLIPSLISTFLLEKQKLSNYKEAKVSFGQKNLANQKRYKNEMVELELQVSEIAKANPFILSKKNGHDHSIIFPEGYLSIPTTASFLSSYFVKSETFKKIGPHVSIFFGGTLLQKTSVGIKYYNVVWVYSNKKVHIYKKSKLVPVYERKILMQDYIQNFCQINFTKGLVTSYFKKQGPITMMSGEYLLTICYEVAFGAFIASKVNHQHGVLFVLSNDEWINSLKGKLQHFNFSKLRAIETRKMVVNVSNKGFSGITDIAGNVKFSDINGKSLYFFDSIRLYKSRTFYSEYGDWLYAGALIFAIISFIIKVANSYFLFKNF